MLFSVTEPVLTLRQYGGMYVPCKYCSILDHPRGRASDDDVDLADFMFENSTRATLDLKLIGCWLNDRELLLMLDFGSPAHSWLELQLKSVGQ